MSVLYEFLCPNCGRITSRETVAAMSAMCPKCGEVAKRVYSTDWALQVVPSYHEALEETQDLMDRRKI